MFEPMVSGDVTRWVSDLTSLDRDVSDNERIDQIRALEDLKAAACAAQVRATVDLDASQRQAQADAGIPARRRGEGIASQVGLARRESPTRGAQHLGLAKILDTETPYALAALTSGRLSEWRATLLARETACLSLEDRRTIDAVSVPTPRRSMVSATKLWSVRRSGWHTGLTPRLPSPGRARRSPSAT